MTNGGSIAARQQGAARGSRLDRTVIDVVIEQVWGTRYIDDPVLRRRRIGPVCALIACLLASTACAQGRQPEPQPEVVRLTGEVELARLVDLAAARLGIDVEYDAASVKGTVTLRLADGIEDAELWALANRLLAARGFTTVRMAGSRTLSVVRLADAPGLARHHWHGDVDFDGVIDPVPAGRLGAGAAGGASPGPRVH